MNRKLLILIISFSAGYSSIFESIFCDTKSYEKFSKILCSMKSRNKGYTPLFYEHQCNSNVITVRTIGRLGNNIFEYIVLWMESQRRSEWKPYLPPCAYERLSQVFEVAMPSLSEIQHCYSYCKPNAKHNIIVTVLKSYNYYVYLQIIYEILRSRKTFKKLLVFKEYLIEDSQEMLQVAVRLNKINNGVGETSQNEYTFVGIHVRRTDNPYYANINYYKAAIRHFEVRYKNLIFVVATDDNSWTRQYLLPVRQNIYLSEMLLKENSPALDLVLLASCNHSILTDGTFGFWGTYFAGGDVVAFNVPNNGWSILYLMNNLYIGNNDTTILEPKNQPYNEFSDIPKKFKGKYDVNRNFLYMRSKLHKRSIPRINYPKKI